MNEIAKLDEWLAPALKLLWLNDPDGLIIANPQRQVVTANPTFLAMFGYSLEEVAGKSTRMFYESAEEHQRQGQRRFNPSLSEKPQRYEQVYRRKNGELFPGETYAQALRRTGSGELIAYVSQIRDISQKKRDEERANDATRFLDSIVENIPDMIFVKDAKELRFLRFNRAGETLIGVSREDLLNKNDYDLFPKTEADFFVARDREVLTSGNMVDIPCEPIHTKNGLRYLHTKKIPIRNSEGTPLYLLGISEDITEKTKIEQLKNDFVSTVSHELRTPLTSIRGALGLIRSGAVGELETQLRALVDMAYRNCERLTLLVNDILDIERITSGNMPLDLKPHSTRRLLDDTLAYHQGLAKEFSVRFELVPPIMDAYINVDYQRFMQVIGNLLSNAAKFTSKNDRVEIALVPQDTDHIKISVVDHGPGIAPEFRDKIFQKFSQADASSTRSRSGTGLGLSIAKSLVEQMHGAIGYRSTPNEGSEFYCLFPLAAPPAVEKP